MSPSKDKSKRQRISIPSSHNSRPDSTTSHDLNRSFGRDALGAYIKSPSAFPSPQRVISHSDAFVAIHDVYPKSAIHMLLLPRDEKVTLVHPFEALADPALLASVREEVAKLKKLAASELRRRYGEHSAADSARNAALDSDEPPDVLPTGRDWEASVVAGVHLHPSMSHLHVHVVSVDRVSECMKHRKHYNSFVTPFFVKLEDFPLSADDVRRWPGRENYLDRELRCWRCGKGFGNKFKALKQHLDEEFEHWKRE